VNTYLLQIHDPGSSYELLLHFVKNFSTWRWEIHPDSYHMLTNEKCQVPPILWTNYEQQGKYFFGFIGEPVYLNSSLPVGIVRATARPLFWQEEKINE